MKTKLLFSFLLFSFCLSGLFAQKAQNRKANFIIAKKIKLKDYDPKLSKYEMKEYYTVVKNILIPAKGIQMLYSKKHKRFFILNEDAVKSFDELYSKYADSDNKDIGNDMEFGCLGCRRDSKCVPDESMDGSTTYCANPCSKCAGFVTTKKDDSREFQTINGDWNNLEGNW